MENIVNRHGKNWTVSRVRERDIEQTDFRFWYHGLTPAERVEAVSSALESCLKTRGCIGIPRLRRVHRRGARYLIIGAHAIAFHVRSRATKDLDILLDSTRANAQ